jgi:hypothetical protein
MEHLNRELVVLVSDEDSSELLLREYSQVGDLPMIFLSVERFEEYQALHGEVPHETMTLLELTDIMQMEGLSRVVVVDPDTAYEKVIPLLISDAAYHNELPKDDREKIANVFPPPEGYRYVHAYLLVPIPKERP